jgi:hypothetical protein
MKSRTAWCWLGLILALLLGVLAYLGWKMYLSGHSGSQSVASQVGVVFAPGNAVEGQRTPAFVALTPGEV